MMIYVNHLFFKESEELPMIKKHFKKLVGLALTAVMVMGMATTTFAKESNNISNDTVTKTNNIIYSPEFPDAYIVTETSPAPNNYSLNNESKQLDTITATVFVEETLLPIKMKIFMFLIVVFYLKTKLKILVLIISPTLTQCLQVVLLKEPMEN